MKYAKLVKKIKTETKVHKKKQNSIQKEKNILIQKTKQKPPKRYTMPYTLGNHILLVGEGNFSFASSLSLKLSSAENIIASAYDSQAIVHEKYKDAEQHISIFEEMGGTCLYNGS